MVFSLLMSVPPSLPPSLSPLHLQCHRPQEQGYVGEILLGIKWSPNTDDKEEIINDHSPGQLQVYIVEGAGMVDEDTRKPFNAFIKWLAIVPLFGNHGDIYVPTCMYFHVSGYMYLRNDDSTC